MVVQHGVPYIRFGFAPLEADAICAWGESSRDHLESWAFLASGFTSPGFRRMIARRRAWPR